MGDLKNPAAIYFKSCMFLVSGTIATVLLIMNSPTVTTAFLVAIAIWSFCRLYYFAFYVIEHYVDSEFKFSGIIPAVVYLWKQRRKQ